MIFRGGFDFDKPVIIASHDASFDNMPNHKSQRGFYIMVGDGNMKEDHTKLYPRMLLAWSSGRIGRAEPMHILRKPTSVQKLKM